MDPSAPEPEVLRKAATAIAGPFPAADVALYISTLLWQDPDTWGALADAPERTVAAAQS